jgi:hypothetical protein
MFLYQLTALHNKKDHFDMDEQTSSDNISTTKSFGASLRGWLIRVGLMPPPYGEADEQQRTDLKARKARRLLDFHYHDLPRYRR